MHASVFYLFRIPLETDPGRSLLRRHFQGSVNAKRPELSLSPVAEAERSTFEFVQPAGKKRQHAHGSLTAGAVSASLLCNCRCIYSSYVAGAFAAASR